MRNKVDVSRLESYFFNDKYSFEDKGVVASHLMRYTEQEAIALFKKMLNDDSPEMQNFAIFPLLNVGEFDIAFEKYKLLILKNEIHILLNLTCYGHSRCKKMLNLMKKYQDKFIPFLKDAFLIEALSYELRYGISDMLYHLGEKKELKLICEEILEKCTEPRIIEIEHSPGIDFNAILRDRAKTCLKIISEKNK